VVKRFAVRARAAWIRKTGNVAEFKNPNQSGGGTQNNSSVLLIITVVFLALTGYQYYQAKHNPQTASPNATAQTEVNAQGTQNAQSIAATTPTVTAPVNGQKGQVPAVQSVVGQQQSTSVVENELYRITFSNKGGQATSWILKRFKDSYGKPLNLVHTLAAEQVGYPLALYTYDPSLTANLNNVLYQPSATGTIAAPGSLTFKYVSGEFAVTKTFTFDDTYVLHADVQVLRNGAPVRALIAWPGGFGDQEDAISYAGAQVDVSQNGKEQHIAFKKVVGGATLTGGFNWAGVSDLYFASIFLPDDPSSASVATLHDEIVVPKAARHNGLGQGVAAKPSATPGKDEIKVPILGAALGDLSGHTQTRIFVGPKTIAVLKNIHATGSDDTLAPLLDFGFFSVVGKPLFYALRFINEHVSHNWGWDIVWLTVLINLVILPLRIKTMQSGLKMQRIQPQMDAIKARYKSLKVTDPKRNEMNAEVMQLQKDNGVNMFGGCIPTLIQMPLLLAFFGMLPKVVELRHAHWFWLPDLSAADPYHILPIVMVISQFLVQFYTPSPGVDPQQQKMMAFMMPAVSGYMTWNYASGLALYWSVGNLISIATQGVMNRTSLGAEMREIAAKRARRKAGIGVGGAKAPSPKLIPTPKTIQGKSARR
jgi:YidC/Oxa1 family membrane protein insertase